jgi:flagellar hook-associated protein 2
MGGISTGVGIFSGIDSASLIDQLIAVQSRPLILAQSRVITLNQQQAAYLDINTRLSNFKTAAASFRVNNIFDTSTAASNNESVLKATASSSAVPGSYNFIVDRLVSSQQLLTRGFANANTSAIGIDSLTFESPAARIDSDTALADLNNGEGINRGILSVTTASGTSEVDLSRAATVSDVLDAFNEVSGINAYVDNDKFVIEGVTAISETSGTDVLSSLGLNGSIAGDTLTGSSVYSISGTTALSALNDGRGVEIRDASGVGVFDFKITVAGGTAVNVRIGEIEENVDDGEGGTTLEVTEGAVSTLEGVIGRINDALSDAGYTDVVASINTTTGAIDIVDSQGRDIVVANGSSGSRVFSTASDLGIEGTHTGGTVSGERIFAGLNTRLVSSLNGGSGLDGTDGILNFTTLDGVSDFSVDISGLTDLNDIVNAIHAASDSGSGPAVTVSVNAQGTGLQVVDNTSGGGTFSISGTGGADTAEALGISGSTTSNRITGTNLQQSYISNSTLVSTLNNGDGIGTGEFTITDSYGNTATIDIDNSIKTVGDLLNEINRNSAIKVTASINANGDGITIAEEVDGVAGTQTIRISDIDGRVAELLGIEGESAGTDADNFITGSEETTLEFEPDATLEDVRNAINAANVGVSASIINTGSGASPFRLSLASENSGEAGRFLIDTNGFDLGLSVLDEGENARVFFGSSDPAAGVLLTSSTNTLDGVIEGVSINLLSTSDDPVEISVSRDVGAIETKITEFIDAFNRVIEGIDFRTRFEEETETRGVLLGDSTMLNLRNSMFSVLRRQNRGFEDTFNSLTQVGITVGSGSKLEFDATKFREAYNDDPAAVEALFTRRTLEDTDDGDPNTEDEIEYSELSVLGQFEEFADSYVSTIGGVLQNRRNALDSQIQLQEDRIEQIQASLDRKRAVLQQQFLAMEQAIGSFQTQGASLSQLAALG